MRKLILTTLLLSALMAGAQGFISPQVKIAKRVHEQKTAKARTRGEAVNENARMALFVMCTEDADTREVAEAVKTVGAEVRVVRGRLIALDIPYSCMETLADVKGVERISMPPKISKKSDVNRKVTQAAEVNAGTAAQLPQAYTGKGVMVGIIDSGFDFTHPMFKDSEGNLRIKGLYVPGLVDAGDYGEQVKITYSDGSSGVLTGVAYSKPEELLDPDIVEDSDGSHGTHCVSIAAGSIMNDVKGTSGKPLGGIAPEADILLANNYLMEEGYVSDLALDMLQCAEYMMSEADKADKPLVVSLSQNSHWGWHDGSSDMAYYLGDLCKTDGMALMLCSSNEGGDKMYIHEKVKAKDTLRLIPFSLYSDNYVWGGMKTAKNVKFEIGIVNLNEGKEYYRVPITFNADHSTDDGNGVYFDFDDDNQELSPQEQAAKKEFIKYINHGELWLYCYHEQAEDVKGKAYKYTQLIVQAVGTEWVNSTDKDGNNVYWGFKLYFIPEENTELHAWGDLGYSLVVEDAEGNYRFGDGSCSVGDYNTSGEPVSVGAWCANDKVQFEGTPAQETGEEAGNISWFSSYGTDLAGHQHPNVCAPGSNVVAAYNSSSPDEMIYLSKDYMNQYIGQTKKQTYYYGGLSGTSMATPAAAGVVALWMQAAKDKGKTLNCKDIKDIIKHSSDTDEYTNASPERFGAGKINAYKGLLYVLGIDTKIQDLSREQPRGVSFRVSGDLVYADGAEDGTPVAVYNLQGVRVSDTSVQGGTISLSGLPQGVYALQLGRLGSTLIRK